LDFDLKHSDVQWTALEASASITDGEAAGAAGAGAEIAHTAITCFNTAGVDYRGRDFNQDMHVGRGKVGSLWFGVDVPDAQAAGVYRGTITISPTAPSSSSSPSSPPSPIAFSVALTVAGPAVADHGYDDLWRLSRMNWLNSRIGINAGNVTTGFTTVTASAQDHTVKLSNAR
jgi:hypothetical protein